jgi:hypothetical protein
MYEEEYDDKFAARIQQKAVELGSYQLLTIVAMIHKRRN